MRQHPTLALLASLLVGLAACSTTESETEEKLAEIYMINAQGFYDGGHYRSAIDQADKVLAIEEDNMKARFVRAMSHLYVGQPENVQLAQVEFRQLVHEDYQAKQFRIWMGLGMACAAVGDLYDARWRKLQKQIDREPLSAKDVIPQRNTADEKRKENWRESNRAFETVLSYEDIPLAKNDPVALYYLYRNLTLLGQHEKALVYEKRHLSVIVGSSERWRESIEKYPAAREEYQQKLLNAKKHEVAVRKMMANTYYELGDLDKAIAQLDEVIGLAPEEAESYLNRAQLFRVQGKHDLAVVDLRKFIQKTEMTPYDEGAQKAVELLRDSEKKMLETDDD